MHHTVYYTAWTPAGTGDLIRTLSLRGLPIILLVLAALIATRVIQWATARITGRIDQGFKNSDELVRSESEKHRHSVAQVISWVAIVIVYLVVVLPRNRICTNPVGVVAGASTLTLGLSLRPLATEPTLLTFTVEATAGDRKSVV